MKHYRSSIPKTARERITATWITGPQKYKAKYLLNRKVVGIRYFHETGEISREQPLKNALVHGIVYRSDEPGKLLSAEPYRNGLPHGVAKQWSDDGKLMGTYSMKHGTGLDLWWQDYQEGPPHLAEARYLQHGKWHGFTWWLHGDHTIWEEQHFWNGKQHGIERHWSQGRLRRGYPRYWINDTPVTKRQYIRACASDPSLPPFREKDNRPRRRFPPEIRDHLN